VRGSRTALISAQTLFFMLTMSSARVTKAREFRRDSTKPEKLCWELLRDRRVSGIKFRRQHPIGPYFADFACLSAKLVVEIDGEHHAFQQVRDARRTAFMEREGWRVLRFWAVEVFESPEGI
jgi:very-short-patch-repair endonuclease